MNLNKITRLGLKCQVHFGSAKNVKSEKNFGSGKIYVPKKNLFREKF